MATSAPILATRNLGLDIGGARIVADVSLEVRAGEFVGIIGPNGAGKTTLFNLLSGLLRPTAGSVELAGRDVTGEPPFRRTRAGLGRTFQVSSVFPLLTRARERAARGRRRARRDDADLAARRRGRRSSGRRRRSSGSGSAAAAPGRPGCSRTATSASSSSRCCSSADPHVILLDEPMAGVSVEDVDELVELIRSVHREEGKTVLMVEHRMEVVVGLAERIAVMHHGALLAFDEPDKVMANETVQTAYLGEPL